MIKRVCDLCGKELDNYSFDSFNRAILKIKVKANKYTGSKLKKYKWTTVDLCGFCQQQLKEVSLAARKAQDG